MSNVVTNRTEPAYRSGVCESAAAAIDQRSDGTLIVRNPEPLDEYPTHLTQRLVFWAQRAPERPFLAHRDASGRWRRVTFSAMLEQARALGQALLDRGLSAERPLVILSENDLEHGALATAAQFVGVPFAPISPAYSLVSRDFRKLQHIVQLLTPGLVYCSNGERYGAAISAAVPESVEVAVGHCPPAGHRTILYSELLATTPTAAVDAAHGGITPGSIAKFLFTSGSTQAPKAVINLHRMLCSNQQMILQAFPFMRDEPPVLVDWLPWNHTFGGNHNYGIALYNGGTLHIDDGKPIQPLMQETLRNLREISPTVYFNVPKGFEELVQALERDQGLRESFFRSLRLMFYAGAGLPKPVADRLDAIAERHCSKRVGVYTGLGMTETAPFAIGAVRIKEVAGAIGNPAPGVTLKLVPTERKLELRYQGPNVTPGYWRAPALTAAAFDEEGFFRSGDAVRFLDCADPGKGLVFDGRLAEDFKLSTGTWVSVGPLRAAALIEGAPHVHDVVVSGHDRDEVGLLIFPRLDSCRALAALGEGADARAVIDSEPVRAFFIAMIERLSARASGSANRVTRALILAEPPSIDLGEVTDKGSINQRAVLAHRTWAVEALYGGGAEVLRSRR